MLSFIRSLPFVGIALLFVHGVHSFIVGGLTKQVEEQQIQINPTKPNTIQHYKVRLRLTKILLET